VLEKVIKIVLVLLSATLCMSCNKRVENSDKVIWGKTDFYSSFLFKKYEPVVMTRTIEFEFNEDARNLLMNDIVFEPVEKDKADGFIAAKGVNLNKNGTLCINNLLTIRPNEKEAEIGIEFTEEAGEGNHTLYLRVKNTGGLDRIDNTDVTSTNDVVLMHEWVVKKDDIYNPLAVMMFWGLMGIVGLLLLWRIVLRQLMNPHFAIRKIEIVAPDFWKILKIKGCYKVVCSNKMKGHSFLHAFFVGDILFVVNDFFIEDVELFPKNFGKTIEARVNVKRYDIISPRTTKLNQPPVEITKGDSKATIKVI
jgi:hypothetical protein